MNIRDLIRDSVGANQDVMDSHRLVEDLAVDSLTRVELAMDLEDEFKVELSDDTIESWVTVGDVIRSIPGQHECS